MAAQSPVQMMDSCNSSGGRWTWANGGATGYCDRSGAGAGAASAANTQLEASMQKLFTAIFSMPATAKQAQITKEQIAANLEAQRQQAIRMNQLAEAQRLDAMIQRLQNSLKLEGSPDLQLKLGDEGGIGVCGLPGLAVGGQNPNCPGAAAAAGASDDDLGLKLGPSSGTPVSSTPLPPLPGLSMLDSGPGTGLGICGLPGVAVEGQRPDCPTDPQLELKLGNGATAPADATMPALPANPTPQQIAEYIGKLPPQQQEAFIRQITSGRGTGLAPAGLAGQQLQAAAGQGTSGEGQATGAGAMFDGNHPAPGTAIDPAPRPKAPHIAAPSAPSEAAPAPISAPNILAAHEFIDSSLAGASEPVADGIGNPTIAYLWLRQVDPRLADRYLVDPDFAQQFNAGFLPHLAQATALQKQQVLAASQLAATNAAEAGVDLNSAAGDGLVYQQANAIRKIDADTDTAMQQAARQAAEAAANAPSDSDLLYLFQGTPAAALGARIAAGDMAESARDSPNADLLARLQTVAPAAAAQYVADPAQREKMNVAYNVSAAHVAEQYDDAVTQARRDALQAAESDLQALRQSGVIQPGIPLAAQEQADPGLKQTLDTAQQRITTAEKQAEAQAQAAMEAGLRQAAAQAAAGPH